MASCKQEEREPGLSAKQGSKLRSKMLSKEAAAQLAVPSFRVYYSVTSAGAVPFLWESQPGTPKTDSPSAAALPPLTPPPSYYAAAGRSSSNNSKQRRGAAAIFTFLRRRPRGQQSTPRSASSSSSSWSTSSSSSATMSPVFTVLQASPPAAAADGSRGRRLRRTFSSGGADEDADADARCFGMVEPECCERGIVDKGCSVVGAVRTVLAAVVGGNKPGRRA